MIAIFNTEKDAVDYSNLVHAHLIANRSRYNAIRWSDVNKSDNAEEWAVKIPPDLGKLKVPIKEDSLSLSIRQIEKYPKDWKDEKDISVIDVKPVRR